MNSMQSMIMELWLSSLLRRLDSGSYEDIQSLREELKDAIYKLGLERATASREGNGND